MSEAVSSSEATPLIETHELTKVFKGHPAADRATFQVQAGDVFGLLGPNGAGKTTIIRMLLALVRPTAGRALLFGQDIATHKAAILQRTSAIVEAPALYPHLNGWDNLRVMGLTAGVTDQNRMRWALEQMGLSARAKDPFRTYSLGMKQRLCIAAALLTDPQLIILDEPTNGLDPAGMRDIRQLIQNLAAQGRTVFLSSHLLNEVQQVCNRVAIIERGRIIAQGLVKELLASRSFTLVKVPAPDRVRAMAILGELDGQRPPLQEGEYLKLEGAPGNGAAMNRALAQAGIFASEIIPRNLSLEEYFLSVTGQPPMPAPMPGYPPYPGYPPLQPPTYAHAQPYPFPYPPPHQSPYPQSPQPPLPSGPVQENDHA